MISLYGSLRKKFKQKYKIDPVKLPIDVNSGSEMMRAMEANFKGFKNLIRSKKYYQLVRGKNLESGVCLEDNELEIGFSGNDWHLMPEATGSGGDGIGKVILGAVLMVAGTATGQVWLFNVGFSVGAGGVAQMLAPTPQGMQDREKPEERASYLFDGPVNQVEPGATIPVAYGECFVGSITVSGGLTVEDII